MEVVCVRSNLPQVTECVVRAGNQWPVGYSRVQKGRGMKIGNPSFRKARNITAEPPGVHSLHLVATGPLTRVDK
jgi:hypothetical protein